MPHLPSLSAAFTGWSSSILMMLHARPTSGFLMMVWLLKQFDFLIIASVVWWLWKPATRALFGRAKPKDFEYMLFWLLEVNRGWFYIRGAAYPNPIDTVGEGLAASVVLMFAMAVNLGVLLSSHWHREEAQ